jgi:dystonin
LGQVNRRWEDLNKGINVRQKELEQALLRLGQFQHALNELMEWIRRTDKTLDTLKPVYGDPQVIEVELAKLKVMVNDIQAHQSSVDTLNDAGRQIIESGKGLYLFFLFLIHINIWSRNLFKVPFEFL